MKKLFTILLALLILVGCGTGGNGGGNDTEEKVVTLVTNTDIIYLDNHVATDGTSFIAQTMFMAGLTELDKDGNWKLDLAESYTVNDEGTVYTFKIRDDAKWYNKAGEEVAPVTAYDFEYAWNRLVSEELASEYNWWLDTMSVESWKALDEKTFEVTLFAPSGIFMGCLAFPSTFPVNEEFVKAQGDQYATSADTVLACGPFILDSWTPGYSYEMVKNPNYYFADEYTAAGGADKVVFRVLEDTQTALMEYEAGNIDTVILSGEQVDANKGVDGYVDRLQGYLFYLSLNINHSDTLTTYQNDNIRHAILFALDRVAIAKSLNDGSVAAEGIIPFKLAGNPVTGADFRDDQGSVVAYDVDKAKELLALGKAELGVDEVTINLLYGTNEGDSVIKAAEQIQFYLEEVGFKVNLVSKQKKERLALMTDGDYDVALTRWGPDYADPQTYMDLYVSYNTSNNSGRYNSAEYDKYVADAEATTDMSERWQLFLAAEKVLVEQDAAVIPVFQAGGAMIIRPGVGGIEFHSAAVDNYRHIYSK